MSDIYIEKQNPLDLLKNWGFSTHAPEALREHANICATVGGSRIGHIVQVLGLMDEKAIEQALEAKPSNVLTLEQLIQIKPTLRSEFLRILSVSRGLPYFTEIPEELAATALDYSELSEELSKARAMIVRSPDGKPLVIFTELPALIEYTQISPKNAHKHPLRAAVGPGAQVALAPVAALIKMQTNSAVSVAMSPSVENFWSPQAAVTDAERLLSTIFDEAIALRATDIEFAPKRDGTVRIRYRQYGDMMSPVRNQLSREVAKEITNFLVTTTGAGDGARLRSAADGQMTYKSSGAEVFIRASFIPADRAGLDFDMISISLRLMARIAKSVDLQELNLPSVVVNEVKAALLKPYGLIILAGPTNSGKSTTIAGIVGEHVKMYGDTKKRISLEEPVERYLEGITQVTVQHGNFAELIRALLRHDPDMVWVGEIRDAFSAGACVRASTSGHITMSTVHANNSVLAVRAIANYLQGKGDGEMSSGASLFDLAESVSLIIAQRLVKQLCPNCKEAYRPSEAEIETVARYLDGENQNALATTLRAFRQDSNARMYRAPRKNDCSHCQGSGFKGERPICEALPVNRKVRALMSSDESRLPVDEISTFRVNTLSDHAFELVKAGLIELSSMIV